MQNKYKLSLIFVRHKKYGYKLHNIYHNTRYLYTKQFFSPRLAQCLLTNMQKSFLSARKKNYKQSVAITVTNISWLPPGNFILIKKPLCCFFNSNRLVVKKIEKLLEIYRVFMRVSFAFVVIVLNWGTLCVVKKVSTGEGFFPQAPVRCRNEGSFLIQIC